MIDVKLVNELGVLLLGCVYVGYVLLLFFFVNMMNLIDCLMVNVFVELICKEFGFIDIEVGVIFGFGFVLFYGVFGLLIVWFVD